MVKPTPSFISHMTGGELARGERVGSVNVWPTAHPFITIERGERLTAAIRLRPESGDSILVNPGEQRSDTASPPAVGGNSGAKLLPDDPGSFNSKVRNEGTDYWLDLSVGPIREPGTYLRRIEVSISGGDKVPVDLTIMVISENTLLSTNTVDLGRVSLEDLKSGGVRSVRVGMRRLVGTVHINSIQTSHPFLKAESDTLVPGTNYLIRVSIDRGATLRPGSYDGVIQINTDDPNTAKIEIPWKLVVVP